MKPTYNELVKENQELKLHLSKLHNLEKIVLQQAKQIKKLEARLLVYENAHTPSSKQRFKKQPPKEPNGKLGAKIGHKKWDRKHPEPTQTIKYTQDKCPYCENKLGQPISTTSKITEDIPEPRPIQVTQHLVNHYFCKHCKKTIVARNNVPKKWIGKKVRAVLIE